MTDKKGKTSDEIYREHVAEGSRKRQQKFADEQRAMGRKGRKVWALPEEHEEIKDLLKKSRGEE